MRKAEAKLMQKACFREFISCFPELPNLTNEQYKVVRDDYLEGDKNAGEVLKLFLYRCVAENVANMFDEETDTLAFEEFVSEGYQGLGGSLNVLASAQSVSKFRAFVYRAVYHILNKKRDIYLKNYDIYLENAGCEKADLDFAVCEEDELAPEMLAVSRETSEALKNALQTLTLKERVLLLNYLEFDDSGRISKIAKSWGLTEGTVKGVVKKALYRLRHPRVSNALKKYKDEEMWYSDAGNIVDEIVETVKARGLYKDENDM